MDSAAQAIPKKRAQLFKKTRGPLRADSVIAPQLTKPGSAPLPGSPRTLDTIGRHPATTGSRPKGPVALTVILRNLLRVGEELCS